MKKYGVLSLIIIGFGLIFLFGCAQDQSKSEMVTEKINLYYGDANNDKLVSEERMISYPKGSDKYQAILEALIKGPEDTSFKANISPNTKVFGTIKQGNDLIVDFSKEFNHFGGSMAEIIGVGSVVNTMTQLDNIKRVKILVAGEELIGPSGNARGFMESFSNQPDDQVTTTNVVLYFGNKDATKVVGEIRKIAGSPEVNKEIFIKKIVEELIAGPKKEGLYPTIPKETKVLSIKLENGTAFTDFSEEMQTEHWGGAAGESMTINSIVNTLTEWDFIKQVQITVNSEPLAIENIILDKPVKRNENMIAR